MIAWHGARPQQRRHECHHMPRSPHAVAHSCGTAMSPTPASCPLQKCDTADFCKRHRGVGNTKYAVQPSSVQVKGAALTATLTDAAAPQASFALTLTSYAGGVVRMHVDEPGAGRYQVRAPGGRQRLRVQRTYHEGLGVCGHVHQPYGICRQCCAAPAGPAPPLPRPVRIPCARQRRSPTSWRRGWTSCSLTGRWHTRTRGRTPSRAATRP